MLNQTRISLGLVGLWLAGVAFSPSTRAADLAAGTYIYHQAINSGTDYNLLGNVTFEFHGGNTHDGAINVNGFTLTVDAGGGNETRFNGVLSGTGGLKVVGGGSGDFFQNNPGWLSGAAANTLSGTLTVERGTVALAKPAGVNAHAGNVIIRGSQNQAILRWENSNQLPDATTITLAGPEASRLKLQGHSEVVGQLIVQSDGDIFLGNGATVLRFADSSAAAWTAGRQLVIREWNGSAAGGGAEQVFFGASAGGLTAGQLTQVGFMNPAGFAAGLYHATLLASGEVVPSGAPVAPLNPPYDLSSTAQVARAIIYTSNGRTNLVAPGTPLAHGSKISFFGDSITWLANGAAAPPAHAATANPVNNFNDSNAYYDLLGRALAQGGFGDVTFFNHAINGGGAREIEEGIEHYNGQSDYFQPTLAALIASDDAAVVVIYIGINDAWWRGTTTNQFTRALSNMVASVHLRGARAVLVSPAVHGERPDGSNADDAKIDQFTGLMRGVAQTMGATFVDIRAVFIAWLRNFNYEIRLDGAFTILGDDGLLTYDGVHPSDAGHALLADHIAQGIHTALGGAPPVGETNGLVIDTITTNRTNGIVRLDFHDTTVFARNYLVQTAPVVTSNQFAILDAALLNDLGGQQFSALITPAGVPSNSFFRVAAFPPNASNGPVISAQPQNQTVLVGAPANFSVTASGASLAIAGARTARTFLAWARRPRRSPFP